MEATVAKTVNSWHSLGTTRQAILLIGPSHTGRTTLAELIKKHVYGISNPNLVYDNGKYNLEGVISNKSIKIQTIYPALYEKSHKDKDELKIIDVPSFIYSPENKKWGPLEQKLTLDLMVSRSQVVGFLLFIDEKSTRTNIIPWKKAILNFLELFRPESLVDEGLLDSIGMAITKAPPDTKEETMIARLKQLQTTFAKEKHPLMGALDRIIKNIIDNNRIVIFKKVSDDEAEREGITATMAQLEKMVNYTISRDHFKEQPWQPEGEKAVGEYFANVVDPAFSSLAAVARELVTLPDFSPDSLRKAKQKWREGAQDISVCDEIKQRLTPQDPKAGLKYLPFIKNYAQLAEQYAKVTPKNLEQLIQAITKLGLFDNNDEAIFQIIYEGLQFKKVEDFKQFQLEPYCNAYAELFSQSVQAEVYKKLALAEAGNEKKEFYQDAIDFIRSLPNPPATLTELQETFKKKLIKYANPKEALQLYAKEISAEKNQGKQFALASDIAMILDNKGLKAEAGKVYRAGRNTHAALQCLREAAESDQKVAVEYISYLAELTLFERAVLACYEAAGRFGYESREQFAKSLKEVDAARKKHGAEGMKITDFSLNIEVEKVMEMAISALPKL